MDCRGHKVSVIIPVYNVGHYVSQCLESVVRQTFPNLEILVIDDGSTDGSGELCDGFAERDSRIRVLHTENHGLSAARNLGLAHASGDYLSFLDSDDWMEPDTIETLLNTVLRTGADAAAAHRCQEFVGKTVSSQEEPGDGQTEVFRGPGILPAYVTGIFLEAVWNKLYNIRCFEGIRFPEGRNYEDVSVMWKIMKTLAENGGSVALCPDDLFHYRMRKSSIVHTDSPDNTVDVWTALRERYQGLPGYPQTLSACMSVIGRMWKNYSGFPPADRKRLRPVLTDMRSFSREHFRQIMTGPYEKGIKRFCLVSQSSSPFVLRCCHMIKKLRSARRNDPAGELFD